jgi:hypothetical protein
MKKTLLTAAGLIVAIAALALLIPAEPLAGGSMSETPVDRETPGATERGGAQTEPPGETQGECGVKGRV